MARKRVPAAEARAGMKDLVDAVKNRNERIKITRYGKTVAYLVPAQDGEALENCANELDECARRSAQAARSGGKRDGKTEGKLDGKSDGAGKVTPRRITKTERLERAAARTVTAERLRKSLKSAGERPGKPAK